MAKQVEFYRLNNSDVARGSRGLECGVFREDFCPCPVSRGCSSHSPAQGGFATPGLSCGARGSDKGCQGSFLESRVKCEPRVFVTRAAAALPSEGFTGFVFLLDQAEQI